MPLCVPVGLKVLSIGRWVETGAVLVAAIVAFLMLVVGAIVLLKRRRLLCTATLLVTRQQWDALLRLRLPFPQMEWLILGSLAAIPFAAVVLCFLRWPFKHKYWIWGVLGWIETIHASLVLGLPISLFASVLLAWLASLRWRFRGLQRAASMVDTLRVGVEGSPYRGGRDRWAALQAWVGYPGVKTLAVILLSLAVAILILLPTAIGAFLFLDGQIKSMAYRTVPSRLALQAGFVVAGGGLFLCTMAAVGMGSLPLLQRWRLMGIWDSHGGAVRRLRRRMVLLIPAAGFLLAAQPFAVENASPLDVPGVGLSYRSHRDIKGVPGMGPDPWVDRTLLDVSMQMLDGTRWNWGQPLDEMLCNQRKVREQLGQEFTGEVNLTCDATESMVLVRAALGILWRTEYRDVSLVWVDHKVLDRPILSLERVSLTTSRFELVPRATEGAIDPREFRTCGAFADALLELGQRGNVRVMSDPSEGSVSRLPPWWRENPCLE